MRRAVRVIGVGWRPHDRVGVGSGRLVEGSSVTKAGAAAWLRIGGSRVALAWLVCQPTGQLGCSGQVSKTARL